MPTRNAIDAMHRRIIAYLPTYLPSGLTIDPVGIDSENWGRIRPAGEVTFEMIPHDPKFQVIATRIRGGRVAVFPLQQPAFSGIIDSPDAPAFWFSWFERWRKERASEFRLVQAGWTFFLGSSNDEKKSQILRAEWEPMEPDDIVRAAHGQPHWHVDGELSVSPFLCVSANAGLSPSDELFDSIRVDNIHLAMAGWDNQAGPVETGWHRFMREDCSQLATWACGVFDYVRKQLDPSTGLVRLVSRDA